MQPRKQSRNGTCGIAKQAATEGEVALLEQLAEPAGLRRVGREPTEHAVPSPVLDIETLPPLRETHLPFLSALSLCLSRACLGKMIICSINGAKKAFSHRDEHEQVWRGDNLSKTPSQVAC